MFQALETIHWKSEDWAFVEKHQLLREIESAGSTNCSDCSRRYEVEYISERGGGLNGYINCEDCGLERVEPGRLKRWEIDTTAMLRAFFDGLKLSLDEQIPDCLWKVGRANWAGYSRHVWFVRSLPGDHSDAVEILKRNKKAIVFAPTQIGSTQWHEVAGSLVIPLDSIASIKAAKPVLNVEEIEGWVKDTCPASKESKNATPKRRGSRLNSIAKLRKALIEHVLNAREHAYSTKEITGTPRLLPRPQQKELAKQLDMTTSDVNRALKDDDAVELRIYWELALDVDQIMSFKGPITRGRKT
ncbi:hypothetical protein ACYFX5_01545 [Bremerella sp. T1]|uniref:hypothetical protein n=1 Tax=Bremerella sp. TYQ1 TaxID=3119568 RepID=UPI001CCDCB5D|nr:hypothetical protein [Bremerella volcania]UBM36968.1 hypothetical protein LA756_03505 [Bremerella volcania]